MEAELREQQARWDAKSWPEKFQSLKRYRQTDPDEFQADRRINRYYRRK
jgi:hypothetical protein